MKMDSKDNWPFSRKFVFSLVIIISFFIFLEGATFLYTNLRTVIQIKRHKIPAWRGEVEGRVAKAYSTMIDYKMLSYSQMRFCPVEDRSVITINSLGFRGKEFSTAKDKNVYRVIILGGSAAFGKGASSNNTTIAGYLERFLNERIRGKTFEVYNMAISGYISAQELITFELQGIDFKPDLVIDINGYNDLSTGLQDVNYPYYASVDSELIIKAYETLWKGPFYSIALVALKRWSCFVSHLSAKIKVEYNKRYFAAPGIREGLISSRVPRIEFYIKNMNTMYALADYHDFNLLVILQPTVIHKSPLSDKEEKIKQSYFESGDAKQLLPYILSQYYPLISAKMSKLKNNRQHSFIDFSRLFQNVEETAFLDIVHYTDRGNEIFAERLYEKLPPIINERIQ